MNKEYCIKCGHKNTFEFSKPKFCGGCGSTLNSVESASASVKVENSSPRARVSFEEEDEPSTEFNQNRLRTLVRVEGMEEEASVKIENLLNTSPSNSIDEVRGRPTQRLTGEDLLKQIRKDCSKGVINE